MNIKDFPLAWRWTSESHAVLPAKVLQELTPIKPNMVKKLIDEIPGGIKRGGFTYKVEDEAKTKEWLSRLPVPAEVVTVIWDKETGLEMPWTTFVSWWSDFCYPNSDDVTIIVRDRNYLLWHHDEVFEFSG